MLQRPWSRLARLAAAVLAATAAPTANAQRLPCSELPESGMERPRRVALSGFDSFGGHYVVTYTSFLAFATGAEGCAPLYWYSDIVVHYNLPTQRYLWGLDFGSLWGEADGGYPTGPGVGPASRIREFAAGRGTAFADWVIGWDPRSLAGLQTGGGEPFFGEFGLEIPDPDAATLHFAPEPATVVLTTGGLVALAGVARRKRRRA
jgi:hypothetical protein